MEENLEARGSLGPASVAGSSMRRRSFNSFGIAPYQTDGEAESESVSEAGDIGDRAIHSRRNSRSGSLRLSFDRASESSSSSVVVPIAKESDSVAPAAPLPEELAAQVTRFRSVLVVFLCEFMPWTWRFLCLGT